MATNMRKYVLTFVLSTTLFIGGCSCGLMNLSDAKSKVAVYYRNGLYEKEVNEIIQKTVDGLKDKKYTNDEIAIFDVDETALSNMEYVKDNDFGYNPKSWEEWIHRAKAKPIDSVKRFYDILIVKGMRIVFLSGRSESQYKATVENLHMAGYNTFDTLIVQTSHDKYSSTAEFKYDKRKESIEKGNKIELPPNSRHVKKVLNYFVGGVYGSKKAQKL